MYGGHKIIGVIIPQLREYLQKDLFTAVAARAAEYGFKLFIYNSTSDLKIRDTYSLGEATIFNFIGYDALDGLIILSEALKDEKLLGDIISKARAKGIFTVCIDKRMNCDYNIEYNYHSAFEAIVRHVIVKHGCKVINLMAGIRGNSFSEERVDCARRVMAEYGIELEQKRIGYGDFWTGPTIQEMNRFAAQGIEKPEAYICCNDSMAMAVCGWLKSRGLTVPEDIIVTGFDGIYEETFHIPRLTTAQQDCEGAGIHAVDAIAAHLEGRKNDSFSIIDHKVRYTHSCGCVPIDYRQASGLIFPLFDMMSEDNKTDAYLFELDDKIASSNGLQEVSQSVLSYASVYGWYYYAIAVNDSFLSISDDYDYNKYINSGTGKSGGTTRLILCESLDGETSQPYNSDRPQHFDEALDKYDIMLFWPIHFQSLNVGCGVCALSTGCNGIAPNDDMRRFAKYSRNLNHSLEVVNSQQVLKKVISRLQELYIKDHTGLLNRNGFYNLIHQRLDRASSGDSRTFLVIITMDMDGLKTINDKYGHAEGDVAINAIADALKSVWGPTELCARFGGDEFTIATMCKTDPNDVGLDIVGKIKSHLDEFNKNSGKPYRVRGSYGIWYEQINKGLIVDEMIKRADDLMYKEKATHSESRYSGQ